MKKYYLPMNADNYGLVYFGADVVCLDRAECDRLEREYIRDGHDPEGYIEFWREASADEISKYGVYDS